MNKKTDIETEKSNIIELPATMYYDLRNSLLEHEQKEAERIVNNDQIIQMQLEAIPTSEYLEISHTETGKVKIKYDHVGQAMEIIQELRIISNKFGMFYFDEFSGLWKSDTIARVKQLLHRKLGKYYNAARERETIVALGRCYDNSALSMPFDRDPNLVGFINGVYNFKTNEFRWYKPTDYITSCIPHEYNPAADNRLTERYFSSMLGDKKQFWYEWIGYCLYKSYSLQKFVIITGGGNNGKSTLLDHMANVLGKLNVANFALSQLHENSFLTSELVGKYANICADISDDYFKHSGTIKQLTGNDGTSANRKGKESINFINHAKMAFSCNVLPTFRDKTEGLNRRIIIMPMNNQIKKTKVDFMPSLLTPEEIQGTLIKAIAAFQRVLETKDFSVTAEMEAAKLDWLEKADYVRSFVENECSMGSDKRIERSRLFDHYCKYCEESKVQWLGRNKFFDHFLSLYPQVSVFQARNQHNKVERFFKGIDLI